MSMQTLESSWIFWKIMILVVQRYKECLIGTKFILCIFLSNIWKLALRRNYSLGQLNLFLAKKIVPHCNLIPFTLRSCSMEHGWNYHFVSSLGKVPFSPRLRLKKFPKGFLFIHFVHWKKKRLNFQPFVWKGEIPIAIWFFFLGNIV